MNKNKGVRVIFVIAFLGLIRILVKKICRVLQVYDSENDQRKNRFEKLYILASDMGKSVLNFDKPNQTIVLLYFLVDISGHSASFFRPIFALEPWYQDICLEYYIPE